MTSPAVSEDRERLPAWAPPVVFAVLTLAVFRGYLVAAPGEMLFGQDTIAAGVMFRQFFLAQVALLGRLPLWNPYLFGGVPTVEAGSGDFLYPTTILHAFLPFTAALAWKLIVHVFLAGVFAYLATRALGARRIVALFAGCAWLLSANLVSLTWGGQDGKLYVIALFPAAVWLLLSGFASGSWVRFLWLGAVCGLMLVAHPQLSYYAYLALGLWGLALLWAGRSGGGPYLVRRAAGGVVALALALGTSAVVLLPMYRYLRDDSPRAGAGRGFEYAASWSLHAEETVGMFIPDFAGTDVQAETYWGKNAFKHNLEYAGALVLVLGVAGAVGLRGDRRRWGLLALAVTSWLYAMGAGTPAFRLMYELVPGLGRFRAPSLAMFLCLAALLFLAALLLERVASRDAHALRVATWSAGGGAGLALLLAGWVQAAPEGFHAAWTGLFGSVPGREAAFLANAPHLAGGAVLVAALCGAAFAALAAFRRGLLGGTALVAILTALTAAESLRTDARYVQVVPYDRFFPADPTVDRLRASLEPGQRVLDFPGVLPTAGHLATYGVPQVFGYHGNQLRWYDEYTRRERREGAASAEEAQAYWLDFLRSPALKALAAPVVILPGRVDLPGLVLEGAGGGVAIYRDTAAMRAATVVPRPRVEPDLSRQLDLLWTQGFDPRAEVLVQEAVAEIGTGGGTGSATIVGHGADTVAVEATSSGPALLLISRPWHPSWEAEIAGQPVRVLRADHALIAVPLPGEGTHRVVLRYRPRIVRVSAAVSGAAWLVVVLGAIGSVVAGRRRERRGG